MDCPSEENLIRMKLEGHSNIEHLEFDIPNRQLTVFHHDNIEGIETAIPVSYTHLRAHET